MAEKSHLVATGANVLDGKLPPYAAAHFSGAQITALRKQNASIRPLAYGIAYRRLASRLAMQSNRKRDKLHSDLEPHQISVCTAGGLEFEIHPTRHTFSSNGLLSIHFSNAFNRCSRRAFLDACQIYMPALARYIHYTYGTAAFPHNLQQSFLSQECTQQGNPLGTLLFSLVAQPLIMYIQTKFGPVLNVWMADDGNIVASIDVARKTFTNISGAQGLPAVSICKYLRQRYGGPQCRPICWKCLIAMFSVTGMEQQRRE